ncbi:hypothetical protein SUGI_0977510 [Cryptomeria japonica]|nr:hypothetical protein SUGI_0977510 [Cryptomeria japonica]
MEGRDRIVHERIDRQKRKGNDFSGSLKGAPSYVFLLLFTSLEHSFLICPCFAVSTFRLKSLSNHGRRAPDWKRTSRHTEALFRSSNFCNRMTREFRCLSMLSHFDSLSWKKQQWAHHFLEEAEVTRSRKEWKPI